MLCSDFPLSRLNCIVQIDSNKQLLQHISMHFLVTDLSVVRTVECTRLLR